MARNKQIGQTGEWLCLQPEEQRIFELFFFTLNTLTALGTLSTVSLCCSHSVRVRDAHTAWNGYKKGLVAVLQEVIIATSGSWFQRQLQA